MPPPSERDGIFWLAFTLGAFTILPCAWIIYSTLFA